MSDLCISSCSRLTRHDKYSNVTLCLFIRTCLRPVLGVLKGGGSDVHSQLGIFGLVSKNATNSSSSYCVPL